MTEPYKTIFLQWENHADWDSMTWCQDRVDDDDVEYIRKDIYDTLKTELAQQKRYTNSAVEYAEKLDNHDTDLNAIIDDLREEQVVLVAELNTIKPDWEFAPEWAEWLAMDKNGMWFWYSEKPTLDNRINVASWRKPRLAFVERVKTNWRNTLERRPTEES